MRKVEVKQVKLFVQLVNDRVSFQTRAVSGTCSFSLYPILHPLIFMCVYDVDVEYMY